MRNRVFKLDHRRAPGLVGLWGPGPAGGPLLYDKSGPDNNGALSTSATWAVDAERGQVFHPISNSYAKVLHNSAIDFADVSFSVSLWFNATSISNAFNYILSKNFGGAGVKWYGLQILSDGTLQFTCDDGTDNVSVPTGAGFVSTGQWYHVVAVRAAAPTDLMYLYVNGALENSIDSSAVGDTSNTGDLYLGIRADLDPNRDFNGLIDDIRIYNRDLSAAEAEHIFVKTKLNSYSDIARRPSRVFKAPAAPAGTILPQMMQLSG